jgi:predicted phosphodiesterase
VGGSQTSWTSEGTTIYGALKGNPNLFLMLCGHNHGIGRRVDVDNGNTIYSVLQDYQSEANGGDSWLRYFTFSPATNKITANVIRCRDGARRTDAESQFEMTYNMQSSAPWTDLGTVNVSAGSTTASIPWSGLAVGTGYEWYATVSDGVTPVTSSTRSFTAVTPTSPPTVVITAPANGTSLIAPATITVTADASDTDGTVSKVEFFNGATKLGEDLSEPFSFEWTGVPIGDYTLTARATDNMTATSVSAALVIHVIEDPRPRVTLAATDATAGEYGSDRGLGFTVSRTGPTTRALVVPLVAGGTASAGSDFTGFSNSVTIPAGSASLALSLTILSDDLVEGTETVTISLGSSPDFVTGSPASANATITDRLAPTAAWRFGVIGDTQQTQNVNSTNNSCAINIISAVNQQFVARNVDMVLAAGDLADNGSVASLQTRLAANAGTLSGITGLGSIPFYAVRGNHDDNSSAQTYFQGNFIPASNAGVTVSLAPDNTSYAVNYKGASFVFLDILATKGTTSTMDQQTTWMNSVLGSDGHEHAFVVQHKNLLGQNHKDNAFGSSNDANPTQQNNFFKVLSDNGVRYNISGHDHMNHRAIVTSPDGNYKVQQIITQSASTKFYNGTTPYSSREQCVSDEQDKIGFYIYTVEGSKITGEYWATDPVGSDIPANPVWTLRDTFGYSINGKQATVARDGSYAGITDSTAKAVSNGETGYLGTSMSILAGTNTNTGTAGGSRPEVDDLNTGWAPKPATLASDVLTLWGMNNALGSTQTDTFTLSLSYDPAISHPMLVTRVGNDWVNAVSGNTGGTSNYAGNRPFNAGTDTLGSYGFDSTTHTAWAVINHDSDFAVMPDLTRPTVTIVATDNTSGEFNSDPTLVFTLSRTGSTAAPLSVTLTAGGSATSGADYSGFTSPVIFPAGSATATVTLTVLADNAAEGPETVTLALDSSPQIFVGSPASANASIADSPAQNFYYTNIPDPALRGPNQDTDGDGVPNALEFAFGLNPTANDGGPIIVDGSSITRLGQMPSMRIAGSAVSAVFGRRQNYQESGLTYKVKFSSDLGTWYDSTDTVNLKYAGTPDLSHPAVVASQGDMDAVSIPFPLFIKTANGYEKTQSFMMIEVTTP